MKKGVEVSVTTLMQRNRELRTRYNSPLIKWYNVALTMEQKLQMGMITQEEYDEYEEQLAQELAEKEAADAELVAKMSADASGESASKEPANHTFWEDDEGDRENISSNDYADFLAANGVNVNNSNTVDISAIMQEMGDTTEADMSEDEMSTDEVPEAVTDSEEPPSTDENIVTEEIADGGM